MSEQQSERLKASVRLYNEQKYPKTTGQGHQHSDIAAAPAALQRQM